MKTLHRRLRRSRSALFLLSAGITLAGPDPSRFPPPPASPPSDSASALFGVCYALHGFGGIWNCTHYRNDFIKAGVQRDFAILAALNFDTVKFYYSPSVSMKFAPDAGAQLWTASIDPVMPYYDDAKAFAPELFTKIVDYGMRPSVSFMTNELYNMGPNGWDYVNPGPIWWDYSYARGPGLPRLADDFVAWENGILHVIQTSAAGPYLLACNLATELPYRHGSADWTETAHALVAATTRRVAPPLGTRTADPFTGQWNPLAHQLYLESAYADLLDDVALAGGALAYTEYHPYPQDTRFWPGLAAPRPPAQVEQEMADGLDRCRHLIDAALPRGVATRLIVGEVGASFSWFGSEAAQADAFMALWRGARTRCAAFYNWCLFDANGDGFEVYGGRNGFGFTPDEPRDVLGRVSELRSDLPGGDFETGLNGWTAGSAAADGATLTWHGAQRSDAATGNHCIRLTVTKPGTAWLCSPPFALSGVRAALSAYARTNAAGYSASLYTYKTASGWSTNPLAKSVASDAAGVRTALTRYTWEIPPNLPAYFDPANMNRFFQFQSLAGGHVFDLPADTTGGVLCFTVTAPESTTAANPLTLDLDTISIHGFTSLRTSPAVPAIVSSPASQTVSKGDTVTLSATVTGNPPPTCQWYKNGVAIPGANAPTLTFRQAQLSDAGNYTVVVTNAGGSVTSIAATLAVVTTTPDAPALLVGYASTATSATLTWRPAAAGLSPEGYLLERADDPAFASGSTTSALAAKLTSFIDPSLVAGHTYYYRLFATNSHGASAPTDSVRIYNPAPPGAAESRLINISTRALSGPGSKVAIVGFVVEGSSAKNVLLRAVGPSLAAQGLPPADLLRDPKLDLHDALRGNAIVASNDNWNAFSDPSALTTTAVRVGATAVVGSDSTSAAALELLAPGIYTFTASGVADSTGVVLAEAYDADPASSNARILNLSSRVYCAPGNGVAIGGFVISGGVPKRVLIRAVGPTLSDYGLAYADILRDPTIELHDSNHGNAIIAVNDNWSDNANAPGLVSTAARIGAAALSAEDATSAALLITLPPGVYSFLAAGHSVDSGIVLVELYDADEPPFPAAEAIKFGVHQAEAGDRPLAAQIAKLGEIGADTVRLTFGWDWMQPSAGVAPNFAGMDTVIDAHLAAGVEPLMVIAGSPTWASGNSDPFFVPTDEAAFSRWLSFYRVFVRELAAHYRGRVTHWELWNEPNVDTFWKPVPNIDAYARWAAAIENELLAVDPTARIAYGSVTVPQTDWLPMAISGRAFLSGLYDRGLSPRIVSVHPYPDDNRTPETPPHDGYNVFRDVETIRALMNTHGGRDAEIWVTEYCWWSGPSFFNPKLSLTEDQQADYFARSLALVRRWPRVTRAIWFWDWDIPGYLFTGAGLVRDDGTLRPAALVLKNTPRTPLSE